MSECTCGWTKGMRSVCICPKDDEKLEPLHQAAALITLAEPPAEPMVVTVRPAKIKTARPKPPKKPAKPAPVKKKK